MKLDTAMNWRDYFINIVRDSINSMFSHSESLNMISRSVFQHEAYKRIPRWAQHEVDRTVREEVHCAYKYGALQWCLEWKGERYDSYLDLPEEAKEFARKGGKLKGYHYWKSSGKQFSEGGA